MVDRLISERALRALFCLCLALATLAGYPGSSMAAPLNPPARPVPRVLIVRLPAIRAYEDTIDEFRGRVRGDIRVWSSRPASADAFASWAARLDPGAIFVIGQSASDLTRSLHIAPVISAFALERRPEEYTDLTEAVPLPRVLRMFQMARPTIRTVGVLVTSEDGATSTFAGSEADSTTTPALRRIVADSPAQAISRLRVQGGEVDALWLPPNVELLSPQVFQFALAIQFRRRIPLMGATRRHAAQGALLSLDYSPHAVGRRAALVANQILARAKPARMPAIDAELTLNVNTAMRIAVDPAGLRREAALVVE